VKAEGRREKAEGRRQKAEGRREKAEGRREKAKGRRQKAEDRRQMVYITIFILCDTLYKLRVALCNNKLHKATQKSDSLSRFNREIIIACFIGQTHYRLYPMKP
jgi:ABC-type xylose transport system permease subunit